MRKLLLSTALVLAASSAQAADYLFTDPPPMYGSYDQQGWSGQYLGATLGSQSTRIELPAGGVLEGYGLIGGLFAGVNYEQDSIVYGAEADVEWNSFDQAAACTSPAWYCNVQGSLRARLGYAVDSFLVYGTAGIAASAVGGHGWTAGLGAEAEFSDAWFGRAEYRYTALGAANDWYDQTENGVISHAFRAGVGYRF